MALSVRQRVGVGLLIGAALAATYGVVALVLPSDPAWLETVARIVTLVAGALGFTLERKSA